MRVFELIDLLKKYNSDIIVGAMLIRIIEDESAKTYERDMKIDLIKQKNSFKDDTIL